MDGIRAHGQAMIYDKLRQTVDEKLIRETSVLMEPSFIIQEAKQQLEERGHFSLSEEEIANLQDIVEIIEAVEPSEDAQDDSDKYFPDLEQ